MYLNDRTRSRKPGILRSSRSHLRNSTDRKKALEIDVQAVYNANAAYDLSLITANAKSTR